MWLSGSMKSLFSVFGCCYEGNMKEVLNFDKHILFTRLLWNWSRSLWFAQGNPGLV